MRLQRQQPAGNLACCFLCAHHCPEIPGFLAQSNVGIGHCMEKEKETNPVE